MPKPEIVVWWIRDDLRLSDNAALWGAVKSGRPLVPLFIGPPVRQGRWSLGAASRWWLHQSLTQLDAELRRRGSRLIVARGEAIVELKRILQATGGRCVAWNRRYGPASIVMDGRIECELQAEGIETQVSPGNLLVEPWDIRTTTRLPFRVFTPYWNACLRREAPALPLPAPPQIPAPRHWPKSMSLAQLHLKPAIDWAQGLRDTWSPGEHGALEALESFLADALSRYPEMRDRPDQKGSSRLSPHLRFGEISVRTVWHAIQCSRPDPQSKERQSAFSEAKKCILRQLGWREFSHHVLYHFPETTDEPLKMEFARLSWKENSDGWQAWKKGETGYPIVDAGMRELWATGWMHNRVRMIAASFLVKDLGISWVRGAEWFWDTLVDADLANNTMGWQWCAGCGADAAPYFRIFNPVLQGRRFDPNGDYVRRWVPELAKLPTRWIHCPWEAPGSVLDDAGIQLQENYPRPIVDHSQARRSALDAFARLRSGSNRPTSRGAGRSARKKGPS